MAFNVACLLRVRYFVCYVTVSLLCFLPWGVSVSTAAAEEGQLLQKSLAVWKTTALGRVGLAAAEITKGICGALPPLACSFKAEKTVYMFEKRRQRKLNLRYRRS